MSTTEVHKLDGEADVPAGTNLMEFMKLGMRADVPRAAVGVLEGVIAELSGQSQ